MEWPPLPERRAFPEGAWLPSDRQFGSRRAFPESRGHRVRIPHDLDQLHGTPIMTLTCKIPDQPGACARTESKQWPPLSARSGLGRVGTGPISGFGIFLRPPGITEFFPGREFGCDSIRDTNAGMASLASGPRLARISTAWARRRANPRVGVEPAAPRRRTQIRATVGDSPKPGQKSARQAGHRGAERVKGISAGSGEDAVSWCRQAHGRRTLNRHI